MTENCKSCPARTEATRQAEEQIKLLREALEKIAKTDWPLEDWAASKDPNQLKAIASQALEATNG